MADHQSNPPCPRCAGASWKTGTNMQGRRRYFCRACRRMFTDATASRLARRREREERLAARRQSGQLRRARTLAEYFGMIDPRAAEVVARSPDLSEMVRRSEYARREGVSREYVRQLIKDERLLTIRVGGVEWVQARAR